MKVDGELHDGGNNPIVANDFTQILSDGIGYWANDEGKSRTCFPCLLTIVYWLSQQLMAVRLEH